MLVFELQCIRGEYSSLVSLELSSLLYYILCYSSKLFSNCVLKSWDFCFWLMPIIYFFCDLNSSTARRSLYLDCCSSFGPPSNFLTFLCWCWLIIDRLLNKVSFSTLWWVKLYLIFSDELKFTLVVSLTDKQLFWDLLRFKMSYRFCKASVVSFWH